MANEAGNAALLENQNLPQELLVLIDGAAWHKDQRILHSPTHKLAVHASSIHSSSTMTSNNTASFFEAARRGTLDQQFLDRFLENEEGGIDKLDLSGFTALALAAVRGHVDTVKLLLSNGANVNKPINDQKNILGLVAGKASCNRPDIIGPLLDAGAHVDATSPYFDSNTPLMLAIKQFPDDEKSIKLLLGKKASLDFKNKDGEDVISLPRKSSSRVLDLVEGRHEKAGFASFVGHILSFILHILGLVNASTGGIIGRVFQINPPIDRGLDEVCHFLSLTLY